MEPKDKLHCGIVAIVGRANVGKSTLMNNILGEKVAIVSRIPQTTRSPIRGILTEKRGQIVFVDTPGIHLPKHRLGKYMNLASTESIKGADVIIHLVDTSEPTGEEERLAVSRLKSIKAPIILGLNKIDLNGEFVPEYIKLWQEAKAKPITELTDRIIVLPLSGLKGVNKDKLLGILFSLLPEGQLLYPEDTLTDLPEKIAISDIIQEKLFNLMRQEIPHALAVLVDEFSPRVKKDLIYIKAKIYVETQSQKQIIIGKDGWVLKRIGTQARREIEQLLEKKIFLELYVEVKKDWRQDSQILKQLGYI